MLARVRKSLQAGESILKIGDIVDVSGWRNVKSLVSNRYIELVDASTKPETKPAKAEAKVEKVEVEEVKAEKTKSKK
jgi:hypothetical protein